MPSLASFSDPKTFHILTYGLAIGSNFFQSFLAGPIAFKAIPRPSFATLQTAITPAYFALQGVLSVALALTWPGERIASVGGSIVRRDAGVAGLLAQENLWTALVPMTVVFTTSAVNMVLLGPWTTKAMKERKHQETKDGKRYHDPGPKSPEMERMNRSFMILHSASALANLAGFGALIFYGATLAEKL